MKIKTILLSTTLAFTIICGGVYYYCFQRVTDYYTIMYTPYNIPLAQVWGHDSKLAQPKLIVRKEKDHNFKSDKEALEWLNDFAKYWKEDCLSEAKRDKEKRMILEKEATCQFMLMSFTHTRNVGLDDLKEELNKRRSLGDLQRYCEDHGLNAKFYLIETE
jgi:hypothetical protein